MEPQQRKRPPKGLSPSLLKVTKDKLARKEELLSKLEIIAETDEDGKKKILKEIQDNDQSILEEMSHAPNYQSIDDMKELVNSNIDNNEFREQAKEIFAQSQIINERFETDFSQVLQPEVQQQQRVQTEPSFVDSQLYQDLQFPKVSQISPFSMNQKDQNVFPLGNQIEMENFQEDHDQDFNDKESIEDDFQYQQIKTNKDDYPGMYDMEILQKITGIKQGQKKGKQSIKKDYVQKQRQQSPEHYEDEDNLRKMTQSAYNPQIQHDNFMDSNYQNYKQIQPFSTIDVNQSLKNNSSIVDYGRYSQLSKSQIEKPEFKQYLSNLVNPEKQLEKISKTVRVDDILDDDAQLTKEQFDSLPPGLQNQLRFEEYMQKHPREQQRIQRLMREQEFKYLINPENESNILSILKSLGHSNWQSSMLQSQWSQDVFNKVVDKYQNKLNYYYSILGQ